MPGLWIVDADPARRRLLAELAAAPDDARLGAPGDRALEGALSPGVVLLGVGVEPAAELDFVHRMLPATSARGWLLFAAADFIDEARRLFDHPALGLELWPPDPEALRGRVAALASRRGEPTLSERARRDAVERRFATFFADLALPEIGSALHPRHTTLPLLIRGEPGTGRRLLARHRHEAGALAGGAFAEIACGALGSDAPAALERALALAVEGRGTAGVGVTVFLHEVTSLPVALQRAVADWIELAPPPPLAGARRIAFVASAPPAGAGRALELALGQALAGLELTLPALRDRLGAIPLLVERFAEGHAFALGEPPRRFADEAITRLEGWPFPGNVRELEAVVRRSLLATPDDPVPASALRVQPGAPAGTPALAKLRRASGDAAAMRRGAGAARPSPAAREPAAPEPAPSQPPLPPSLHELVSALTTHLRGELAPLRALVGSLAEADVDGERRLALGGDADRLLDQLGDLVERVDSVARLPAPELVPLDLPSLVNEVLDPLRAEAEARKVLVLTELDRVHPVVYADRELLRAVLCAIAGFALAEVPERGDLFVSSRYLAPGSERRPSQRVLLRFRAKNEGRGNELALALARWLARALEARFELDASDATETVLMLELPAPEAT